MKPAINRSGFRFPVYRILPALLIVLSAGCGHKETTIERLAQRYLHPMTSARPSFDYRDPTLFQFREELVHAKRIPVTRIKMTREYLTAMVTICQPVELNFNNRTTGVSFFIRSISGTCAFTAIIRPEHTPAYFYIHPEPIRLQPAEWTFVSLDFGDFSNIVTRLNLDVDAFNPIDWNRMDFVLLISDISEDFQVIDIGPFDLNYQHERYHFH